MWKVGRRSVLRAILAPALLAALLLSCAEAPLKIGFVGPLTGSSSAIGLGCRNGFLMALGSGADAAPGRLPAHALIVMDDRNNADDCLAAFKELKEEGCSVVVLGTPSQASTKAIPWAVANGVLVISPTVSTPIEGPTQGLFLRVNLPSAAYGATIARVAFEKFGKKRVGTIGDARNSSYVEAVRGAFEVEFEGLGGKPAFALSFEAGGQGKPTKGLVEAIRATGADGLFAIAASTEVVLMAKELERSGIKIGLFLPPWPLTRDLLQNGGQAVEGAIAVSIADLEFRRPAGMAFESAYKAAYGEEPSFTAMFGYEAAAILRKAIAGGTFVEARALSERIIALRDFEGLQGGISFDARGDATRAMFLFTVKDGAFKLIE